MFCSEAGKDLRQADLLLFNFSGKEACVYVTRGSPFADTGVSSWAPSASLANVAGTKRKKCSTKCEENRFKFIPFVFSFIGELGEERLVYYQEMLRSLLVTLVATNLGPIFFTD